MQIAWVYLIFTMIMFTSSILTWIALVGPDDQNPHRLSLLAVTSTPHDGPNVWLGLFTSCYRANITLEIKCTSFSLSPQYDFSVLPSDAPTFVLKSPVFLRIVALFTTILAVFFLLLVALFASLLFYLKRIDKLKIFIWQVKAYLAGIAFLLSFIGTFNFLFIRVYFDTTCYNFNLFVTSELKLITSLGDAFELAYWGYGIVAVPFVAILWDVLHTQPDLDLEKPDKQLESGGPTASTASTASDSVSVIQPVTANGSQLSLRTFGYLLNQITFPETQVTQPQSVTADSSQNLQSHDHLPETQVSGVTDPECVLSLKSHGLFLDPDAVLNAGLSSAASAPIPSEAKYEWRFHEDL